MAPAKGYGDLDGTDKENTPIRETDEDEHESEAEAEDFHTPREDELSLIDHSDADGASDAGTLRRSSPAPAS